VVDFAVRQEVASTVAADTVAADTAADTVNGSRSLSQRR
jgi:hypothetical protein